MRIVWLLLFCIWGLISYGQNNTILGQVQNKDQQPIATAPVELHLENGKLLKIVLTDTTGNYQLDSLPPSRYFLIVNMVNYTLFQSAIIDLKNTITSHQTIVLSDSAKHLATVQVTSRKKLFEMRVDKMVMNVENSILETGNSVYEIIQKAPMVSVDKDQNILLKGLTPQIYVDDKPVYISGIQLTEYLKSLPSESIASIEYITTPSSKYDAAGSAGIINIRLKKNRLYGLNGILNTRLGYGKYPKAGGGLSLNYRNGWLNAYANWNTSYSESFNALTYNSKIINNNIVSYQDRNNYWHPKSTYNNFKTGVDINIGKKNVLSLMASGDIDNTRQITTNNTTFSDAQKIPNQYISTTLIGKDEVRHTTYNINFKRELDSLGSSLIIDGDYTTYNQASNDSNVNIFLNALEQVARNPYIFRNNRPVNIRIKSAKLDYTKYWTSTLKLESGLKYSSVHTDNNFVMDSLRGGQWDIDYSLSNHFIYKEDIAAAYTNIAETFGKFSLQVGLRGELTRSNANSITLKQIDKRDYFNLFPTFFSTYKLNDNNEFNLSYSRRISRPSYQSLNPFVRYIDPYTSFKGNPFLRPAFSNSFELKHGYKQFLYTSLSYSHTAHVITTTILQDPATGKVINTSDNASSQDYVYLNIFATLPINKWWTTQNSISGNWNHGKSTIPNYSYSTSGISGQFNTDQTFSLPHTIKIQTSFWYSIPSVDGLAKLKSGYGWNLGIQKQVWNNKGTLKLAVNNLLAQAAYRAHYLGSGLDINWINRWEARRVTLSFVYKFGNQKVKAASSRRTSSQDEQNRVNL